MHDATVERVLQAVASDVCVDRSTLAGLLRDRPPPQSVIALLCRPAVRIVRAAVVYLTLYATPREWPLLALCLKHADAGVARLAEHGLWSLWMRAGTAAGNGQLAAAVELIRNADYAAALALLDALVEREPEFAEAHFQRGVALSLLDRNAEAARAYRASLRQNPCHFAAAAALGHACIELGDLPAALHHYRRALHIHPGLDDVREALRRVESIVGARGPGP